MLFVLQTTLRLFFLKSVHARSTPTPTPFNTCRVMEIVGDNCPPPYFQCRINWGADFCCPNEQSAKHYNNGKGLNCSNFASSQPTPTISSSNVIELACGQEVNVQRYDEYNCQCNVNGQTTQGLFTSSDYYCCGWYYDNSCHAKPLNGLENPINGPDNETFNAVNPLYIGGAENIASVVASDQASTLSTPGGIVSRVLDFLFPLAGLILFVMLVWGGFEIMMGSVSKKIDAGKQRVTAAIVGFLLLFASYWIWQILQVVFGIKVL